MLAALLVLILAPQATFLVTFGLTRRWWTSWEGRALIASSVGWTLVAFGFLLDEYVVNLPRPVWLAVAAVAVIAAWLKLWIVRHLIVELVRAIGRRLKPRRPRHRKP